MELADFLNSLQADVDTRVAEGQTAYREEAFSQIVIEHMAENGMTLEPQVCHLETRLGNAKVRLSGYAISQDADRLDLFVTLYAGARELQLVPDSETKAEAEKCLQFVKGCAKGKMSKAIDPSQEEAFMLAHTIEEGYSQIDRIQIFVLTDRKAKSRNFQSREESGKLVSLEVMDIERLYRHLNEGKPRDELTVDFTHLAGGPIPCVYVTDPAAEYDYALTAIPGEILRFLYEKHGPRLLEANVRSFLSVTGKVNKGIRDTLRESPDRFMAYNNGIVLIVDELRMGRDDKGMPGVAWLRGLQIVNGGQTTASLYFTKRKEAAINLDRVRVPTKIIVLKPDTPSEQEEEMISLVSQYSNTQNQVKVSDLSANKPFHIELEKLASTTWCPDGVSRWFYERAAGSYKTLFAREGTTPAKLKQLKDQIPATRKFTKTDLAKYLNCWNQRPYDVSFGAQKNFERFMGWLSGPEGQGIISKTDVTFFKHVIAKTILFKTTEKIVKNAFPGIGFKSNITYYTVALVSYRFGSQVDLDRIWQQQAVSKNLENMIAEYANEVNRKLHETSKGAMISEWAKKNECWEYVKSGLYTTSINPSE